MSRDYRHFLKAIGRKPVRIDKLRTRKAAGDLEIVRDHRTGGWALHRHGGAMGE